MSSLGKYRHLGRVANADGRFVVLAIDHRGNLLTDLQQHSPQPVDEQGLMDFKQQVMASLGPLASGVLVDPAYGIAQGIFSGSISARMGLLAPLEVTDYDLHPSQQQPTPIPGWSVEKIKRSGGDGAKLLLYYHPDAPDAAAKRRFVESVVAECARCDLPLFLEPLAYSPDPALPLSSAEHLRINLDMARTFSAMGVDVLKMAFPGFTKQDRNEANWESACAQLDAACSVPWTLLSAGVDFDTFVVQARIACAAGASGVIVGRALWAEAVQRPGASRQHFLDGLARERFAQLAEACQTARPWMARSAAPPAAPDWYLQYGDFSGD